ncbi:hypothetical protein PTSG_10657, partial [Salpingoeca rosetta]
MNCCRADASGSAAWLWTMGFSCHGIPCNSPSILIVDTAASGVDTTMLSVPEVRRVPPAQTGNTSSPSDALSSLLILMPCATASPSCTTVGTLCWCARAGGLAKSAWVRKSSTSTRTRSWRWRPSLGSSSWLRVPSPSLSSITTCCPTRTCWTGRRSAFAFPDHRLLGLPRILQSIPDEVVEMMQRRVVFVFEEFFKSISTQVHTALESARINLFSGDNAWQVSCHPTSPSTKHHCSGGMNTRALPCDDHPATLVRLRKQQHQHTPQTNKRAMSNCSCTHIHAPSSLPLTRHAGARTQTHLQAMHTRKQQDEGNVKDTCHGCQLHSPHTCGLACRLLLLQLPSIRLPLLCSCSVPICVSKQQLWTHTSMVMVGTSNHSDAIMCSSAVTVIAIAIDCTAAITLQPTPAPIWREADIAHVSRSDEEVSNVRVVEEAHEAVEPTTMKMTSDEGPCIRLHLSNRPTKQPSERAKDTAWQGAVCFHRFHQQQQQQQQPMSGCIVDELALCISSTSPSSSSSLVANSSGCGHGWCDVRRCAVASHDDDAGG